MTSAVFTYKMINNAGIQKLFHIFVSYTDESSKVSSKESLDLLLGALVKKGH